MGGEAVTGVEGGSIEYLARPSLLGRRDHCFVEPRLRAALGLGHSRINGLAVGRAKGQAKGQVKGQAKGRYNLRG